MLRFALYLVILILMLSGRVVGQTDFKPAPSTSPDEAAILEKMDARLEADLAGLASLPKANRNELSRIYTDRASGLKGKVANGHFLFEKAWEDWLHGVANEIFRANPELPRRDVRLFWGRYAEPNACSYGEGSVVFNVGLLAFMDDEADAAFVLAHELAHFAQDHSGLAARKYVDALYSEETQRKLKNIKSSEFEATTKALGLLKTFSYDSRRHGRFRETEADSLAIVYLSKTKYDATAAVRTLEILDRTDSVEWAKIEYEKLFDAPQFPFKQAWLGQKASSLSLAAAANSGKKDENGWDADSLKTHPDCRRRMARAERQLAAMGYSTAGKGRFVQPEATFSQLKKWAPLEVVEGLYAFEHYGEALFRTLQLMQDAPDDAYLNAMVGRCLYHLHRHQQAHTLNRVLELSDARNEAEYDRFLRLMNQFRLRDLAQVGYFFCENRLPKFREDEEFFFAATLASHANELQREFAERRQEHLRRWPKGKFAEYLKGI